MPYGLVGKMLEKELKRWTRPESIPATHLLLATSKNKGEELPGRRGLA